MKLPTDFKTISDFCLQYNLIPIPPLLDWMMFGFPPNVEEVDISKYTEKKTKKKK